MTRKQVDYPALLLHHVQRLARRMDVVAADAQKQAEADNDETWGRIAFAGHHEADTLRMYAHAMQECLDGGPACRAETQVYRTIAKTRVALAQHWRVG